MSCTDIDIALNAIICGRPPIAGTEPRIVFLNYSEIDRDLSIVVDNVIQEIVLKDDAIGYPFESADNSTLGAFSLNKGTYFSNWQHDLTPRIFVKTERAKKWLNKLTGARVVALVENKEMGENGDTKWEAYGWDAGLELNEATNDTTFPDNTVYVCTLGSGEASKEASIPKSVFAGTLADTELMINELAPDISFLGIPQLGTSVYFDWLANLAGSNWTATEIAGITVTKPLIATTSASISFNKDGKQVTRLKIWYRSGVGGSSTNLIVQNMDNGTQVVLPAPGGATASTPAIITTVTLPGEAPLGGYTIAAQSSTVGVYAVELLP